MTREDGTHTLQTDDECDIHNGDAVDVVAGLPYSFRIVYTDPVQSKSLRRGQKKEVEVPDFAPMQTTIAFPSLSTGTFSYDADKVRGPALVRGRLGADLCLSACPTAIADRGVPPQDQHNSTRKSPPGGLPCVCAIGSSHQVSIVSSYPPPPPLV